jgi:hypothetical protein
MYVELPTGLEHAKDFRGDLRGLVRMVNHPMGIDVVKGFTGKWELAHVGLDNFSHFPHPLPRQFQVLFCNVNSRGQSSMLCELEKVASRAAAYLQNFFTTMKPKLRDVVKPWVLGIPLCLRQEQRRLVPMALGKSSRARHRIYSFDMKSIREYAQESGRLPAFS